MLPTYSGGIKINISKERGRDGRETRSEGVKLLRREIG